jgi:hypothetical protein
MFVGPFVRCDCVAFDCSKISTRYAGRVLPPEQAKKPTGFKWCDGNSLRHARPRVQASAVFFERHPLERTVRWRTVANELSMNHPSPLYC